MRIQWVCSKSVIGMSLMISCVHEFSWKNDGGWHTHSALERAIGEALMKAHEQGVWEWQSMNIEGLPCDNRDKDDPNSHYPELCYHYRVTITA